MARGRIQVTIGRSPRPEEPAMADPIPPTHRLAPDLAAIDAFAAKPEQPAEAAGLAARALYDDVVCRLAHADLPAAAHGRVLALERRAADMVAAFVRRGLPPRYFWPDFAGLAHELDAVASDRTGRTAGAADAHEAVVALRRLIAEAGFPPAVRGRLHAALAAYDAGAEAHAAGTLGADALADLAMAARGAVTQAAAEVDALPAGMAEARFHRLAEAVLGADLDAAAREAIAAPLATLHAAWTADAPLPAGALDELEALLADPPARPFEAPAPEVAAASLRLAQAANRVAAAPLPPFVARAAGEILGHLGALLGDRMAGRIAPAECDAAFDRGIEALEACMGFARDVAAERDVAARRVVALARRIRAEPSPAWLAGPLEDELVRLQGLLRGLEDGRPAILEFHHAFAAGAARIERLLAWRETFRGAAPGDAPPAPGA